MQLRPNKIYLINSVFNCKVSVSPILFVFRLNYRCFNRDGYKNVLKLTVYGKTFEWENFCSFHGYSADRKSFPLESLAVYST